MFRLIKNIKKFLPKIIIEKPDKKIISKLSEKDKFIWSNIFNTKKSATSVDAIKVKINKKDPLEF